MIFLSKGYGRANNDGGGYGGCSQQTAKTAKLRHGFSCENNEKLLTGVFISPLNYLSSATLLHHLRIYRADENNSSQL